MEQPKTLASALEMIEALTAENTTLKADQSALATLAAEHTAIIAERDDLKAKSESLTAEHTKALEAIKALESGKVTLEERANAKAIEMLAAAGVPPVPLAPTAQKQSKEDLWAHYHTLSREARNDFYRKNRDAMRS